ncbi:multiheme c-type cytochrome [Shewanella sp. MEBiC00475]|uniref:multiheme c-type cytochrome n=1 Tax=Shewanella sp. MEBiC00475 TaxID=2575361 RepID=UPI0010C06074|nr:multiheme c-type cytochrome [Shewanella sp. MEBiC00475]
MMKIFSLIAISALFATVTLNVNAEWDEDKGCMSCHNGIEQFSEVAGMADLTCVDCHNGDGIATNMKAAHTDMWANPTDLRVIDKTCGSCHSDEVDNAKTSIHATMAGMISGTRYNFASQDRNAIYATYDVKALKTGREGTVDSLTQIPSYDPTKPESNTNSPGDDYLRNQCLRCHIWSDGHQRDGDYRASGCAACHVEYSNNGTYEGGDKAIDKTQKDRPRKHQLTKKITVDQCQHCHNRGGRTGVSYKGMMESDGYGTPYTEDGDKQGKLHGKHYNFLEADLHYDAGMSCIDCHTKNEMHGDGYLYTKKEHALEIRCESCHGTPTTEATLKTSRDVPLNNLKREGKTVTLTTKNDGKKLDVPQLNSIELSEEGYVAMVKIASHMEKMECSTCHAAWAPQCYGCHAKQDVGKPNGDWLEGTGDDLSKQGNKGNLAKNAFSWSESRSYVRWETPALGINHRGKVSTFVPGCQVFLTQVDGKKSIVSNKAYTTVDGTSGISHNPIQPHTMSKKSRTCEECHTNPKVLGLGSGVYDINRNFPDGKAPIDFELERFVDENGKQLQSTSHEGARPFNKQEMDRISRVGSCLACHGSDEIGATGKAPDDVTHNKVLRKLAEKEQ